MIEGFGEVAERLRRSTVHVGRSGSGVIWDTSGLIITNAHVARAPKLQVDLWDGRSFEGDVVARDPRRDLASLRIEAAALPAVTAGDSSALRVGELVVAVGNPMGFVGAVTTGVVHALTRRWVHADVRLAPGNSGGPLADLKGQIVGINTMIVAGGLALAIPSRAVQSFLTHTRSRRSLGVVVRPVGLKERGIGMMILELLRGGAAERASLVPGDILVGRKKQRFRFLDDLQNAIDEAPGALLRLEFYRAGQEQLRQVAVQLLPERFNEAA